MQLFVKGLDGRSFAVEATGAQSVAEVKSLVQEAKGVPSTQSRLVCAGVELDDARSLDSYEIESEATLHLSLRLLGGGKKKKKNYTTPKVIKHKHKKVKLAVLKYYKIDEHGKITRLRRECTNDSCGAGVFMAAHFDRQYCGKCGLTFTFSKADE
jgi:small subunit ribosomal protein S27Ae